jgi:hypothetical protein
MIKADDARIAVKLDSREAEEELERLRAALEGLDVQTEKETREKTEERKQDTDSKYTLGGVIRGAYDVVMNTLETATMLSPLIRGYVHEEVVQMLRGDSSHDLSWWGDLRQGLGLLFEEKVEPRMKKFEDEMIKWTALIQSVVPAGMDTIEVFKAAALFGEGMSPSDLVDVFGLFMDLNQQQRMLKGDTARRSFEAYGSAFHKMAEKLGEEYSSDRLQAALGEMLEQSFYK